MAKTKMLSRSRLIAYWQHPGRRWIEANRPALLAYCRFEMLAPAQIWAGFAGPKQSREGRDAETV